MDGIFVVLSLFLIYASLILVFQHETKWVDRSEWEKIVTVIALVSFVLLMFSVEGGN